MSKRWLAAMAACLSSRHRTIIVLVAVLFLGGFVTIAKEVFIPDLTWRELLQGFEEGEPVEKALERKIKDRRSNRPQYAPLMERPVWR